MRQLTELDAERLPDDQAAALTRVLDLQARWECLLADASCGSGRYTVPDLSSRQKAYDAYRGRRADYEARYGTATVPDSSLNSPVRLAAWCRVVRAAFRPVAGECPGLAEKAYRLADRITARMRQDSIAREPTVEAVRALDAVVAWCESFAGVAPVSAWHTAVRQPGGVSA